MTGNGTALRVAAAVEALTLVVMLVNIATAHLPVISSVTGPLHGFAYLAVIVATLVRERTPGGARLAALLPGIGGLLALRLLSGRRA